MALTVAIGGTNPGTDFDQLVVSGSAILNGAVNVSLINGYVPATGTQFPFLTYGSYSGGFVTVIDTNPADAAGFSVGYAGSKATITPNAAPLPPQVAATNPPNGAGRGQNFGMMQVSFSKNVNPTTVVAADFTLQDGNGNTYQPTGLEVTNYNSWVQLTYNPLPAGNYTLTINAPAITDPAGDALGTSNYLTHFMVTSATAAFVNPAGGDWNTPSNWQNDQVPGPNDSVLIETGNPAAVITISSGSDTVSSLTSFNPVTLSGGTLTVNGDVQVNNTFTLAGGTLANATVLAGTGGQLLTCTSSGGTLNGVTAESTLDLASNYDASLTSRTV